MAQQGQDPSQGKRARAAWKRNFGLWSGVSAGVIGVCAIGLAIGLPMADAATGGSGALGMGTNGGVASGQPVHQVTPGNGTGNTSGNITIVENGSTSGNGSVGGTGNGTAGSGSGIGSGSGGVGAIAGWQYRLFEIDGSPVVKHVPGKVYDGTLYTSVYDLEVLLHALGIPVVWDVNTLTVQKPPLIHGGPVPRLVPGNARIILGGQTVVQMNHLVYTPPGGGQPTSFLPVYDVQLLLSLLNLPNDYNGAAGYWNISGTAETASGGGLSITGTASETIGQADALKLFQTNNGGATQVTNGITWSVSSTDGGSSSTSDVNGAYTFTPESAGTFTVTATYGGQTATFAVTATG